MNLIEFAQLLESKDVKEVMNVLSALEVKKEEKREEKKEKEKLRSRKKLSTGNGISPRMTVTLTPENEEYVKKGASKLNMSWSLYVNMIIDRDRGAFIEKGGAIRRRVVHVF